MCRARSLRLAARALGAVALLGTAGCDLGSVLAGDRHRPPVIVVALDGVPVRLTGIVGGAGSVTPMLDRLAGEGLAYTACVAAEPWSDLTLAAALSGAVDGGRPSVVEQFARAGWRTTAVLGHDSLGTDAVVAGFEDVRRLGAGDDAGALGSDVVREALAALDTRDPRSPFLLVHLADPRPPHHRYKGLVAAADAPYEGPCTAALPHAELLRLAPTFGARDFARLEALVASEVAAADVALGALLDGLARRGLADEAVVAVVGLRGAWLGEGGQVGLLPGLDPELVHVPFVLRLSERVARSHTGLAMSGLIDLPVTTSDLGPTLAHAVGLSDGAGLDLVRDGAPVDATYTGRDRVRTLSGRTPGRSVLPGAPAPPRIVRVGTMRGHALAAVFGPGVGLIRDLEAETQRFVPFGPDLGPAAAGATRDALGAELDGWLGPLPASAPESKRPTGRR